MRATAIAALGLLVVAALPLAMRALLPASEKYYLHLLIQILLWAFIYTAWALMGRFGLTSLGHGAFTGIGAYTTVMLWNFAGLTPWLGIPAGVALAALVGLLVGYPCFRLRITGHYFALLTLALTEFVRLCIVGLRDYTGGSLGTQPRRYGDGVSLFAVQFEPDRMLAYYIAFALWLFGLCVWLRVDRSMDRYALDAASQDEDAAASVGIDVTREKLKITALSAALCALGGAIYAQYGRCSGRPSERCLPRRWPKACALPSRARPRSKPCLAARRSPSTRRSTDCCSSSSSSTCPRASSGLVPIGAADWRGRCSDSRAHLLQAASRFRLPGRRQPASHCPSRAALVSVGHHVLPAPRARK
jgi:branched-chain amino acid transport system permease protein